MEKNLLKRVLNNVSSNIKVMAENAFNMGDIDDIMLILKAYNRYQEDERDGVDYLFDMSNKEDIITCIQGGLSIQEIVFLHLANVKDREMTNYFLFGVNHQEPKLLSYTQFKEQLLSYIDEIAESVLEFPWLDEYKQFYVKFVTNSMIE